MKPEQLEHVGASTGNGGDLLSLRDLVRLMWRRKILLGVGAAIGLACGVAYIPLLSAPFRNDAVLQLQAVTFQEYKRYSAALADETRFVAFATSTGQFSDGEIATVRADVRRMGTLDKWIRPLFTVTKVDVKDLPETPKDSSTFTGVEIDVELNSAELARKVALASGEYVRDFVVGGRIYDWVLPGVAENLALLSRADLAITRTNFELGQAGRRRAELAQLVDRFPNADRISQRQVISVQNGAEKFLPPVTQLIGVEAELVNLRSQMLYLQRDRERLKLLVDFFEQARDRIREARTGSEQLAALNKLFSAIEKLPASNGEAGREAIETIRVELNQLRGLHADMIRYLTAPAEYQRVRQIRVVSPLLLGLGIGLLGAIFFAIFADWWRRNRATILAR